MLGTAAMSHQTGQGNIGSLINGQNPDVKYGSGLSERKFGTGAEKPLELAGQNPEAAAQQVERIFKQEFQNFSKPELKMLVDVTMKAIQKIGLGSNTDLTLIAREVQSITTPFTQEADELLMSALKRIQEVLNSSDTSVDNNPSNNFPSFGSTPTSSGSALAA